MRKLSLLLACFSIVFVQRAFADDKADVQHLIDEYCRLESNLTEQAKLMTADRVMINVGRRQTDQATNMKVQIENEKVNMKLDPQGQLIVTAADPIIHVYGDTAVASFYRYWDYIPSAEFIKAMNGNVPSGPPPNIVTVVAVKQAGAWKIAHMHMSPLHPPRNN